MGIKRFNSSGRLFWLAFWSIAWFAIVTILWSFSGIVDTQIDKLLKCTGLTPLKLDREIIKTLFNGFGTILLGIGPAVVFWYYRDKTIHINHDHVERDLKIKEDNDAWANFIKYQELAEDDSISEGRRAAAIYALGEYYKREGTQFPQQVHVFFKKYLDKYWESMPQYDHCQEALQNYKNVYEESSASGKALIKTLIAEYDAAYKELSGIIKKIPEHIKAVHSVICSKSHEKVQPSRKSFNLFHHANRLSLSEFNLTGAMLYRANLTGAMLYSANLTGAERGFSVPI